MEKSNSIILLMASILTLSGCTLSKATAESSIKKDVNYNLTTWEWSKTADGYNAKATLKYTDGSVKQIDADVSKKTMVEKTCERDGLIRYTANVIYGGVAVSDYKEETIKSTGHVFNSYSSDDRYHFSTCECGAIESKTLHTFGEYVTVEAPDGWKTPGRKYKECSVCHYRHYESITDEETYRAQIIARAKQALDDFGELPSVENSKFIFTENDIHEIFDYMTSEEILSLDEAYLRKMLSIMFDYNCVCDVDYNGRFVSIYGDKTKISDYIDSTKTYGNVSVIEVKDNIPNRTEYPGVNTWTLYGASKYNFFQLTSVPTLSDKDEQMVIYINAPYPTKIAFSGDSKGVSKFLYTGSQITGTNYFVFDKTKPSNDESKGYINVNQGWNTIVFSEETVQDIRNRNCWKIQMEVVDNSGLRPGTWKISSLISKGKETYSLVNKINELPEPGHVEIYQGHLINDLYTSYMALPKEIDDLYHQKTNLKKLKAEWDSFASFPYGSKYSMMSDVDPNLYDTDKGKCFKFDIKDIAYNKGILHCGGSINTISSPFPCLGFYIKGYDGDLIAYGNTNNITLANFTRVPLDNGWSLYLLSPYEVNKLKTYNLTNESWGYLYLKFNNPIYPGTLYNSPLYSFAVNSALFNNIVSNLPESDDNLRYSDKATVDTAYSFLELMDSKELKKCNQVDRIIRLHEKFPVIGVTFDEAKKQLTLENITKNDWDHFNKKAVYFQIDNSNDLTLTLPKVSYKYYKTFIYQGEMSQGVLIGFNSSDHYTQDLGAGVNEFFTITITTDANGTKINIKVFSTAEGDPDTRSYETFSNVIYDQTRELTDADVLAGEKALTLFVKRQHKWNDKFFIGAALMEYK